MAEKDDLKGEAASASPAECAEGSHRHPLPSIYPDRRFEVIRLKQQIIMTIVSCQCENLQNIEITLVIYFNATSQNSKQIHFALPLGPLESEGFTWTPTTTATKQVRPIGWELGYFNGEGANLSVVRHEPTLFAKVLSNASGFWNPFGRMELTNS
jgi:hypothetical protein